MQHADYFIQKLGMQQHPEGGWFKETYRSEEGIEGDHLPPRFGGERSFSTGIYFLLKGDEFSSFHRIKSDEMWHFYYGGPLNVYVIGDKGTLEIIRLGNNLDEGESFQAVVKAGCWFASRPVDGNSFSLVGCTVAPGFDFADFELANADELAAQFPQQGQLIKDLCRK
jgi:predicted cupin superfamily sugar epimerase